MSTFSRALLIVALLMASTLARSDGIGNPGYLSDGFTGGISNLGKGPAPQPTGCGVGVIDLSTGCVQPMLGGL